MFANTRHPMMLTVMLTPYWEVIMEKPSNITSNIPFVWIYPYPATFCLVGMISFDLLSVSIMSNIRALCRSSCCIFLLRGLFHFLRAASAVLRIAKHSGAAPMAVCRIFTQQKGGNNDWRGI